MKHSFLERDRYVKKAGQIRTAYVRIFGQLIADVYEQKIACILRKKTIAIYQQAINSGGVIDQAAVQKQLDEEMSGYRAHLTHLIHDHEACRMSGRSTVYEVQRSKTLYRRLARLIHPDIYPETDRRDDLKELWQRILTAYGQNDVKTLSELEVLVRKALSENGLVQIDIPQIGEKIDELKKEISRIIHTEPYIYRDLLDDDAEIKKKKAELEKELETYRQYCETLDIVITNILESGGLRIKWRMN